MKALLNAGDTIVDVTGLIQRVSATIDGEVKYSGNGIVIYRGLHVNGDAPIFLNYVGESYIFGEFVKVYSLCKKWKSLDYGKYKMESDDPSKYLISGADHILRKECII